MTHERKPHPLNVIGDFYVEDGCCIRCDVPRTEAPELFALTECEDHCYVKRQPQTDDEVNQMLFVILCADLRCIHYRGNDPAIVSRLAAMGESEVCDTPPPPGTELGLRIHVTFGMKQLPDLSALASSFAAFLETQRGEYSRISFPLDSPGPTSVKYKRNDQDWRLVEFGQQDNRVHVHHDSHDETGASWYLSRWLATLAGVSDIRWFTDEGWRDTGTWHPKHY